MTEDTPQEPDPPRPDGHPPLIIPADALFRGAREVLIEHQGKLYRLRITRRQKLILTRA